MSGEFEYAAIPSGHNLPPGYLSAEEADFLAEWATDKVVLEIGSFLGRSTVAMARTAKHVIAVDKWDWPVNFDLPGGPLAKFRTHLFEYGVADKVSILITDSNNFHKYFTIGSFDRCFIDGDHELPTVANDLAVAEANGLQCSDIVFDDAMMPAVHDVAAWWARHTNSTFMLIGKMARCVK